MQTRSALYNSIFADPGHATEWRITINGNVYGEDKITGGIGGNPRPRLIRKLFDGNEPTVGECFSATFTCAIREASAAVPRMAAVAPTYRLTLGSSASEWITLGTFYIDTRSVDAATGALNLSCFDAMLKANGTEGKSYADVTGFTTWPQPMASVAAEIATIMGVTLDARNRFWSGTGYMVEYPNDYTMWEVLGFIAAAHGANFIITPANALYMVPLTGTADSCTLGASADKITTGPALAAWTGVTLLYTDGDAFEAGTDTGQRLTAFCPWATQATADGLLAVLSGHAYQPYAAETAHIDPALELGDAVTLGLPGETVTGPVISIDLKCTAAAVSDISAPSEDELDHEYPYSSYVDRSLKRKVTLGQSYYGAEISRDRGLYISRNDGKSDITLNSDFMRFRGLVDGVMVDQIYFDPVSGRYFFNGALGADAIFTDSLYAEQGDVAELTVDRLSTSKRIRKYILGDTSDDNYIKIQDQYIQLITGTMVPDGAIITESGLPLLTEDGEYLLTESGGGSYATVQAENRYGQPLYWQREPVSHTSGGYPLDEDGGQIYATTDQTDWPVMVYAYSELIKAQYAFIHDGTTYVPQIILGAGDDQGNNQGVIYKSADGLFILFSDNVGAQIGIKALGEGYMDLYGLRKTTRVDFSRWDSGHWTETVDGGRVTEYAVEFDVNDRPVLITDGAGHETEVVW